MMSIVPDQRMTWRGVAAFVAVSAAGVGIASIPDQWVYSALAEAIRLRDFAGLREELGDLVY